MGSLGQPDSQSVSGDSAVWVYLCPGDILQFEELFHQDLVDLHQNHVHSISVDQRQVSVTLEHTPTQSNVTAPSR